MSPQLGSVAGPAALVADRPESGVSTSPSERQQLEKLASEFESMLMVQLLRDMRRAGRWDDKDENDEGDSLGAQSLVEMFDAELAAEMTRAQGFGLAKQMMAAFDRGQGSGAPATATAVLQALTPGAPQLDPGAPAAGNVPVLPTDLPQASPHARGANASEITSAFGWRRDPITGEARFHRGVDLRAAYGQDVAASTAGQVIFSGSQGAYGTTVLVEHGNGTRTRYAHLSVALVKAGDAIEADQLVGKAGSSGRATGPHLHLEVLGPDGVPIDPLQHGKS